MDLGTLVNQDASRISRSLFTDEAVYRADLGVQASTTVGSGTWVRRSHW